MTLARGTGRTDWDLEVLVAANCGNCGHALTLVRQLHSTHPHVAVKVTDVDEPGWTAPPGFVGTPMFLAAGRILSLGNPTPETLRAEFSSGAP
jgi:hypothetical protein